MNAEFEKYWKSSRASDRPFAETNAQILDKMIAKTHFLAGAATGYANGVAIMKERCARLVEDYDTCLCMNEYDIAAAIRGLK